MISESQANTIMEMVAHIEAKGMNIGATVSNFDIDFLDYVYEAWQHTEARVDDFLFDELYYFEDRMALLRMQAWR